MNDENNVLFENSKETEKEDKITQEKDLNNENRSAKETEEQQEKGAKENKSAGKVKKSHKKLKHGSMAAVFTVMFVAVLVLINVVATQIFERFPLSFDMTSSSSYSISDETIDYVKGLNADVKVTVFAEKDDFDAANSYTLQADEILQKYAQYNTKIKIEYVDLLTNPDVVSEYDDDLNAYDIVFETSAKGDDGKEYKRTNVVSPLDLVNFSSDVIASLSQSGMTIETMAAGNEINFLYTYSVQSPTYKNSQGEKKSYIESSNAEQAFTSALMVVTDSNPTKITFLTGRSEAASLNYYQTLMKANGYMVDSIDITTEDIPADTNIAVIAAPTVDYTDGEIRKVSDFLNNKGKLGKNVMYIESMYQPDTPKIDELLEEYGIKYEDYSMYDAEGTNVSNIYLKLNLSGEDYDSFIKDDSLAMFTTMYTKPIKLLFDEEDMKATKALLKTADTGFKADLETGEKISSGEQIAAAVGYKAVFNDDNTTSYSQVLALGSEYILYDAIMQGTQYLNSQWILSVTNHITGKTTTGITVEPSKIGGTLFDLTDAQISTFKWIFNLVIPAIVLIIGIVVWLRRKNR